MGMSMGGSGRRKIMGEINVTPFVDVVLVLLVIFMVTAPMLQTGINVNLPKATLEPIAADSKPLILTLDARKRLYFADSEFGASELDTKLIPMLRDAAGRTIYLRADSSLAYGTVAELIARLHRAGIRQISLVTEAE